jgi:hypothetical protein
MKQPICLNSNQYHPNVNKQTRQWSLASSLYENNSLNHVRAIYVEKPGLHEKIYFTLVYFNGPLLHNPRDPRRLPF